MCLEEMGMSGELLLTNGVGGQRELASRPSCRIMGIVVLVVLLVGRMG